MFQSELEGIRILVDPEGMTSDREILKGDSHGRFKRTRLLGCGGMGSVFEGLELETGKKVAIKFLLKNHLNDSTIQARFQSELNITRTLDHPNIVRILDFGTAADNQPYIVMEYVDGCNLAESLNGKKYKLKEAVAVLRDIALGLAYAHQKGVIHRDLKPENILVSDDKIKIVDFGLARSVDMLHSLTPTGETVGTPYYMSPEQLRGEKVDGRTDIYALGIIAYQLITNTRPFEGDNFVKVATMHLSKRIPTFASQGFKVPRWFQDFTFHCTEKSANSRYHSMDEVIWVLEHNEFTDSDNKQGLLQRLVNPLFRTMILGLK